MNRADQAHERAAAWLIAQEETGWTDADQAAFDSWLQENDGNKAAYWRMKHSWQAADRVRALGPGYARDRNVEAPRRRLSLPLAMAASLVALVGGAIHLTDRPGATRAPAPAHRFVTPIGERKLIALSDGTKVQLNTASVIRASLDSGPREVWLDQGEAYFEVTHIEGQPFIVHAGNRQVTVLGTKFSVRRDNDKVTVSVLEGRVRVEEVGGETGARASIITGGDIAMAQGDATLLTARSEQKVENSLAWRDGLLAFDQTRLDSAAAEFNRYNRKQMIVTDPEAAAIRIGGIFPANDPDAFSRLLRDAYGLKIEETPTAKKISY